MFIVSHYQSGPEILKKCNYQHFNWAWLVIQTELIQNYVALSSLGFFLLASICCRCQLRYACKTFCKNIQIFIMFYWQANKYPRPILTRLSAQLHVTGGSYQPHYHPTNQSSHTNTLDHLFDRHCDMRGQQGRIWIRRQS